MKKNDFILDNYKRCWSFFKESRWYVVASLVIFAVSFLIGFAYPMFFRQEIFALIEKLALLVENLGPYELTAYIFFNNLKASFFAIIFGVALGLLPIMIAIFNGYLVGFVSREVAGVQGISSLWRLAPHGIFELPAIIFSIGLGMKIGIEIFKVDGKNKLKRNFIEAFRFFVFVVLPLLALAAIIEGTLIFLTKLSA